MKKIIVNDKEKFYWSKGDLHTKYGVFKENDIKRNKILKNKKGEKFFVVDSVFQDQVDKISRGPAVMVKKDIGAILSNVDIDKNSITVDAGLGCGVLSSFLSKFVKKVISYEINEDFLKIAEKNIKEFNIKNIQIKNNDIYKGISEKNLDLITLDLKEPWNVLKHACKSLKNGKYLVVYSPNITQVIKLVKEAKDLFYVEKVLENIEREWIIDDLRARPKNMILGHTGFLVFLRKI
ncbi:hypothetical protein CL617_05740 [archaeon]|nr:hypothetical protein [archaeon]|tara:strand:+ start:523 stop:1230 length:708 start_codon:yes stop_codon:yes gene_type:complete